MDKTDKGQIITVAAGHLMVDCYASLLSPLLPLLINKFSLSLALAGLLTSITNAISSLSQPLFGYLSDRFHTRIFVVSGLLAASVFMSLIGLAGSYPMLLLVLTLGGVGISAFHPQGASMAGRAGGDRRGLGMSLFSTGGNLGLAAGPILIIFVVSNFGLDKTYWALLPGIIMAIFLYRLTPRAPKDSRVSLENPTLTKQISKNFTHLLLIWLIVVLRSMVYVGFTTFLPLFFRERGFSLMAGGASVSVFLLLGALGGMLGGYVSDRAGRRNVILYSSMVSLPLFLAALKSGGLLSYLFLALAGVFLLSAVPVNVVMAQELVPGSAGIASSLIMGLAWGVAAVGAAPLGALADRLGVGSALTILTYTLVMPTLIAAALPKDKRGLLTHLKLLVARVRA